MHRIDGENVSADENGPGKDGFTEGDPSTGVPATQVTAGIMNALQEEIATVIEDKIDFNIGLQKADNSQLSQAIQKMAYETAYSNWTKQTGRGGSEDLKGVAYAPSLRLWCAVGTTGEIQTSPNGVTWTQRTPDAAYAGDFQDVFWDPNLSLFIAVGTSGEIQTSADGVTWAHEASAGSFSGTFTRVGPYPFAVGYDASGPVIQARVGGSWVSRTLSSVTAGEQLHDFTVDFDGVTYVAVGVNADDVVFTADDEDGLTWTKRTFSGSTLKRAYTVTYRHTFQKFFAHGFNGATPKLASSADGITWVDHSEDNLNSTIANRARTVYDFGDITIYCGAVAASPADELFPLYIKPWIYKTALTNTVNAANPSNYNLYGIAVDYNGKAICVGENETILVSMQPGGLKTGPSVS